MGFDLHSLGWVTIKQRLRKKAVRLCLLILGVGFAYAFLLHAAGAEGLSVVVAAAKFTALALALFAAIPVSAAALIIARQIRRGPPPNDGGLRSGMESRVRSRTVSPALRPPRAKRAGLLRAF
jgi:hypothetical protein